MYRVLIAEDEFFNRRLLRQIIDPYAAVVDVSNGREAVRAFGQALHTDEPFDLVLMDIMMPTMDGFEALEQIRLLEHDNQIFDVDRVTVIMVTTMADQNVVLEARQFDISGYLLKPFEIDSLKQVITNTGIDLFKLNDITFQAL